MSFRTFRVVVLISVLACADAIAQSSAPSKRIALPNGLMEVSGLAVAGDNSVFAHNDEHAIVYEIDLDTGDVMRAFALGDPTVAADFEGIAARDGRIYLITSTGLLYEADIGAHRDRVTFNIYDTGVGKVCEIEGLSAAPEDGAFLILCKRVHHLRDADHLLIFRWSLDERRAQTAPWLDIPYKEFLSRKESGAIRPAGIEWDASHEQILIASSTDHTYYAFSKDGEPLGRHKLEGKMHPQMEGIAVMASGAIVTADEGAGRYPGALAIYRNSN